MTRKVSVALIVLIAANIAAANPVSPQRCGCRFVALPDDGAVKVKTQPPPARRYEPARVNQVVRQGDLLQVSGSGSAYAVCDGLANRQRIASPPQFQPVPCTASIAPVIGRKHRKRDTATLNVSGGGFPRLIAPRGSIVPTERPSIRWTTIPGAKEYRVSLRGEGLEWSVTVPATGEAEQVLRYPDQPALTRGSAYKVLIAAAGRSSAEEDEPELGFRVALEGQVAQIRDREADVAKLELPAEAAGVGLAEIYAAARMYNEAIDTVRAIRNPGPDTHRFLSDLYLAIGLAPEAERVLEKVLTDDRLRALDGDAAQHDTAALLEELADARGDQKRARDWRDRALALEPRLKDGGE